MNETPPWKEILKWLKLLGLQQAKEIIEDAVSDDEEEKEKAKRIVYQLTDGDRSGSEISAYVDFSDTTVNNWHQKWIKLGIVNKFEGEENYEHIISLEDAGLECPKIPDITTGEK